MEELKLNETPVRTSRNYNINNIRIKDVVIPTKIGEFNNLDINNDNIKVNRKADIEVSNKELKYGIGLKNNENINIKININKKENKPYILNFRLDTKNLNLVEYIEIEAQSNTDSTIIVKYEAEEKVEGFHNGIIKVFARENSRVNVIILNLLNGTSNNFLNIENKLETKANVKYTIVDFGGKNSITNYYSNLEGNKSNSTINTIYLGSKNQVFDLNYIVELKGEESIADIDVQGAIKDCAKKNFKGTLDFKRGSKKAKGSENEYCTILSDTAKSLALPMLLCEEEDVEGEHATSAGKVGEKELFYMMSRGLELKEALKLMIRAKFNKVIEDIKEPEMKEQILKEIDNRLD